MAVFESAVITEKGLALLVKVQSSSYPLTFTKHQTGSGTWSSSEDLTEATALKSAKQNAVVSLVSKDDNLIKASSVISNSGVQTAYYIKEIGLFATDPDDGEILFSISVASDETGYYMPVENLIAPTVLSLATFTAVTNADNVTISTSSGGYVSSADFLTLTSGLKNKGTTSTPVYSDASGVLHPISSPIPIALGGTGAITAESARASLGASATGHNHGAGNITSGTLPVQRGGTGSGQHSSNSVLIGNGVNYIKHVESRNGAFYATEQYGAPKFGTLPVAQGGTGHTKVQSPVQRRVTGFEANIYVWGEVAYVSILYEAGDITTISSVLAGYAPITPVYCVAYCDENDEFIPAGVYINTSGDVSIIPALAQLPGAQKEYKVSVTYLLG